jgi:hypothetical protein
MTKESRDQISKSLSPPKKKELPSSPRRKGQNYFHPLGEKD